MKLREQKLKLRKREQKVKNNLKFPKHFGNFFFYFCSKKQEMYKILAKLNKLILPSYSKRRLDLSKATKIQKAIIAWRYFITTKALGN